MNSYLAYRFPGKETVYQNGNFEAVDAGSVQEGFLLSNLDLSECFAFRSLNSSNVEFTFHEGIEKPYVMTGREYYLQAHELLNGINLLQMEKAVFSRVKAVTFDSKLSEQLMNELCLTYPDALVYLISDENLGTWIGASPEILLEAHKGYVFTTSLAGTKKKEEDQWTSKEIHEQEIVTDYLVNLLEKSGLKSIETEGPYDYQAGPVIHLKTDISAELKATSVWNLMREIHPSPAVSGFPKEQAIGLIQSIEPHKRELYTGIIGENSKNDSKFYVNLRCAQITKDTIYLYLGGGFTKDSIPEQEWIETENKSKTLINCIKKITER